MKTDCAPLDIASCLDNEEVIAEYLTAAVEDENRNVLLAGIVNVAKAQGMAKVAEAAGEAAMAGRIEGQHVLVTGGARGIGAAIVEKSLIEGARVSFIDIEERAARDLVAALGAGERVVFCKGDVRRARDIAEALEAATQAFGPVIGLVNNAGRNVYADPVAMTEDEWEDVFAIDLKAASLAARAVLPGMKAARKGAIVNIASLHSEMTYPGMFPYAAAKSGLVGLTRSLALEVGPDGIRVNALSPMSRPPWSPSFSRRRIRACARGFSRPIRSGGWRRRPTSRLARCFSCRTRPPSSPGRTGWSTGA